MITTFLAVFLVTNVFANYKDRASGLSASTLAHPRFTGGAPCLRLDGRRFILTTRGNSLGLCFRPSAARFGMRGTTSNDI